MIAEKARMLEKVEKIEKLVGELFDWATAKGGDEMTTDDWVLFSALADEMDESLPALKAAIVRSAKEV